MEQARARRRQEVRDCRNGVRLPEVRAPSPSGRTTCGTATRRRRTRPTVSRRRRCWFRAQAYRDQYGFNSIYLLPVNLYGPGTTLTLVAATSFQRSSAKVFEAKERGDDHIVAWGTGSASREFLYVEDAAEGIVLATERYDGREPVNLGAGREVTIKELIETIARLCEFKGEIRWDSSKPDGQPRRMLDTSRARELFGFEAKTDFEDGLRRTIAWYAGVRECELAKVAESQTALERQDRADLDVIPPGVKRHSPKSGVSELALAVEGWR